MIPLTHLNGERFFLNFDLIESIEACPDTVITLTSGKHLLVKETPDQISSRTASLRRYLYGSGPRPTFLKPEEVEENIDSELSSNPEQEY